MNKIQVGTGASPNIKNVKSRVGSLANASYKPGGGNIKIESHKVDMSKAAPKVKATSTYKSQGGNKKVRGLYRGIKNLEKYVINSIQRSKLIAATCSSLLRNCNKLTSKLQFSQIGIITRVLVTSTVTVICAREFLSFSS